jgi:hypothetical protein
VSKPVRIAIAAVVTAVILCLAGISFAGDRSPSAEASGGGSAPGAPPLKDPSPGSGGHAEQPCGTTVTSGSGPDGVVGYTPCPGEEPPNFEPQVVSPRPGMADAHARPFDDAKVDPDGVTVRIDFVSGVEPCSVLDHVDVAYGVATVTITLFEGHDAAAGEVACIDIGVFNRVVITLDEPLGDRTIVDGAT